MVCAYKWSIDKTSEEQSHRGVCKIDAHLIDRSPEDQAIIDQANQNFQNGVDAFDHDTLAVSTTTRAIDLLLRVRAPCLTPRFFYALCCLPLYSSVPFSTTPTPVNCVPISDMRPDRPPALGPL